MSEPVKIVVMTADELRELIRDAVQRAIAGKPANDKPERVYVSVDVLQQHFGVSRTTVHSWVHSEGCPHDMRGRILRFKMADVEAWFASRPPRRSRRRRTPP